MYRLISKLLFRLDAEAAHELATEQIRRLQSMPLVLKWIERFCAVERPVELLGMRFRNPIGIAAGFDKNATMIPMLAALGFGFIEVGTVTLKPQPGNPRPRLFRFPEQKALINRMGFNNDGADAVADRLRSAAVLPPLFVNVGKNKEVPLDAAPEAYGKCADKLKRYADVIVINVSSPNTPSLRDLQRPEHLAAILDAVDAPRVLVKIAPDLDDVLLHDICDVCVSGADGMICTNTTITPTGGLSGKPLFAKSTEVLRKVRKRVGSEFPLVGVGGVFTADDVQAKLDAGANLVQLYTGFIYEGPTIVRRLLR